MGANGACKTTTISIALGVLAADAGGVRWANRLLDFDTRRLIGYMPEERGLYARMKVGSRPAGQRLGRRSAHNKSAMARGSCHGRLC